MLRWSPRYFPTLLGRNLPEYAITNSLPKVFSVSIRRSYPRPRSTSDVLSLFSKVATTNHYELFFQALPTRLLNYIQFKEPLCTRNFIFRELGLLCRRAELPGAAYATSQVNGNYMGVTQKFAHTRVYTDSTFTFMVDTDYKVISFFQLWQEFMNSASGEALNKKAFYTRMEYPVEYKASTMRLQKFDKDHFRTLDFSFINAFPINITPSQVDYDNNRVLEIAVTFAYDRYVLGKLLTTEKTEKQLGQYSNPYSASVGAEKPATNKWQLPPEGFPEFSSKAFTNVDPSKFNINYNIQNVNTSFKSSDLIGQANIDYYKNAGFDLSGKYFNK